MDYNSKYKSSEIEAMLDKIKNFESGGGKIAVVYHGIDDTTIELTPNVVHEWDAIDSLTLTFPFDEDGYTSQYKAVFKVASASFTLALPYYYKWVNDEVPTFEEGMQYEISFEGARVLWSKFNPPVKMGLIEYVENDGNDYVSTDIILDSRIYGFRHKSVPLFAPGGSSSVALAGARSASGQANTIFTMWYRGSTSDRMAYWNGANITFGAYEEGVVYEDGTTNTQLTNVCDFPLFIFAQNAEGSASYKGKTRFYYLQFLDANDEVIIDLRPWRRKSDGRVGIMDIISNKFYESVSNNLIGSVNGPTILPTGQFLEYIENDGADYIMTDIYMSNKMYGMKYKAMPLFEPGSVQYGLVGARASTSKADTPFAMWYLNSSRQLYYNGTSKTSFGTYASGVIYEDEWSEQNTVSISYPISVFGVNTAGNVQYIGHFRFYGLQILNASGKAICNLRPFMKKNGEIGLLDDVSGIFYPSVNGNLVGA